MLRGSNDPVCLICKETKRNHRDGICAKLGYEGRHGDFRQPVSQAWTVLNDASTDINTELNNVARNTDDTAKARALVAAGADLASTNGPSWRHTPLHQAAYHGRYEMAKALIELGAPLTLHSNPCGRGANGTPAELAHGGGHDRIAEMIEAAMLNGVGSSTQVVTGTRVVDAQPPVDETSRRPLFEIVNGLKRELGLSGNMHKVVHQAAEMLGLEAKGKSLVELGAECGRHCGV
jgi:ankyrin repeat protein